MAQKVTVQFAPVFDKAPIIKAAKEIKTAIESSMSTASMKDNAQKSIFLY